MCVRACMHACVCGISLHMSGVYTYVCGMCRCMLEVISSHSLGCISRNRNIVANDKNLEQWCSIFQVRMH